MLTTIGRGVLVGAGRNVFIIPEAVFGTMRRIYNVIRFDDQFKELYEWMQNLYIHTDVQFVEALLGDYSDTPFQRQAQRVSHGHLHDALRELHTELKKLDQDITAHREKWFATYRPFGNMHHMSIIEARKKALDHCINRFVSVNLQSRV